VGYFIIKLSPKKQKVFAELFLFNETYLINRKFVKIKTIIRVTRRNYTIALFGKKTYIKRMFFAKKQEFISFY